MKAVKLIMLEETAQAILDKADEIKEALASGVTVEPLSVTENGTYEAPSGTAYSPVEVSVSQPSVEALTVSQNGTYTAPEGTAYSPVTVSVPEPSGSIEITQNGTYDVTSKASAVVNVSGGGGGYNVGLNILSSDDDGRIIKAVYKQKGTTPTYYMAVSSSSNATIFNVLEEIEFILDDNATYTQVPTGFLDKQKYPSTVSKIKIGEGITKINNYAFRSANADNSIIELPSTLSNVGDGVFNSAQNVTYVFKRQTPPTLSASSGLRTLTGATIHIPVGKLSAYTSASNYPDASTNTYIDDVVI